MASIMAVVSPDTMEKRRKYVGVNLFVKNLDASFDDKKLWTLFHQYGIIISCKVQLNEDGTSKGFGFVCFTNAGEASLAIGELNGRVVGTKPLYVNLFQSKEERMKTQLQKAVERSPTSAGPTTYEEFLNLSKGPGCGRGRGRVPRLQLNTELSKPANISFTSPGMSQAAGLPLSPPGTAMTPGSSEPRMSTGLAPFSLPGPQMPSIFSGLPMPSELSPVSNAAVPKEEQQLPAVNGLEFIAAASMCQKSEMPTKAKPSMPGQANANTSRYASVEFSSPFNYMGGSPGFRSPGFPDGAANREDH